MNAPSLKPKQRLRLLAMSWHKRMGWIGGIGLLLFALSGLTHPVMLWTSARPASFYPPQMATDGASLKAIAPILRQHQIETAQIVKLVPTRSGAMLQVTKQAGEPRRYFGLDTGEEHVGYDEQQAIWLARYYTGLKDAAITDIRLQTAFDDAYPWVNRILPVYRIAFATDDQRIAFVSTELGALTQLTNDWKTSLQSLFQLVHTWSWLEDLELETVRIILMMGLLLCLLGMVCTGLSMIFLLRKRRIPDGKRRWHRRIAYLVWIPLLLFSTSGIYHLLHYSYSGQQRGLIPPQPVSLNALYESNMPFQLPDALDNISVNAVSLVQHGEGTLLYRFSLPKGSEQASISLKELYDGTATEGRAYYIDAMSGATLEHDDAEQAIAYATQHMQMPKGRIVSRTLVTHFSPDYDFRNKRLPVWQMDYDTEEQIRIFIDPATGMLVDRVNQAQRLEGYSFSLLHKWNPLGFMIGRMARDGIIVVILLIAVSSTVLGYVMLLKRRKHRPSPNDA